MPKSVKERYCWIQPVIQKELKIVDVVKVFPNSKRSIKRCLAAYHKGGMYALEPRSTKLKTQPKETPIKVKE